MPRGVPRQAQSMLKAARTAPSDAAGAGAGAGSTSTLLNGNHAFPPFYACYLLRSKKTQGSRRTYVGSTPDPPRRIRQHNGELTQGAYKTRMHRPWEMQMIVYGFPSKLTALQFEWAWQKPELSLRLRATATSPDAPSTPLFPANASRNHLETKVAVARTMLSTLPWSRWPLHIRVFTLEAWTAWNDYNERATQETEAGPSGGGLAAKGKGRAVDKRKVASRLPAPPAVLSPSVSITLDLGGVDGKAAGRASAVPGVTSLDGPIEVEDETFRQAQWRKWAGPEDGGGMRDVLEAGEAVTCHLCCKPVDLEDHLDFATCISVNESVACHSVTHLVCLAQHFLARDRSSAPAVLPKSGSCPACHHPAEWDEIIRAAYARRDYTKDELVRRAKEDKKAAERLEREEAKAEKKRAALEERAHKRAAKARATQQVEVDSGDEDAETRETSNRNYGLTKDQSSDESLSDVEMRLVQGVKGGTATKPPESPSDLSFEQMTLVTPPKRRKGAATKTPPASQYIEVDSDGDVHTEHLVLTPTKRRKTRPSAALSLDSE